MEALTNSVVSKGIPYSNPCGKFFDSSFIFAVTSFATLSALAPGSWNTAMPAACLESRRKNWL